MSDTPDETTIDLMTVGLGNHLQDSVGKIAQLLDELLARQSLLLSKASSGNAELSHAPAVAKVHTTLVKTQTYQKKLVRVQRDMIDLHAKAGKLKLRAAKLAEASARIAAEDEHRERQLIAKPAKAAQSKN